MSKLLQEYDEKQEAAASHEVIEVKVVAYTEHGVVVDLGRKDGRPDSRSGIHGHGNPAARAEQHYRGPAHRGAQGRLHDPVVLESTAPPDVGKIEAAFKTKETITGKIVDRIKGGIVVDIGVRAFLPGSQYDLRPAQNLDNLTGTEIQVRVTKLNRRRGNVVVSRRALLEEETACQARGVDGNAERGPGGAWAREKRDGVRRRSWTSAESMACCT